MSRIATFPFQQPANFARGLNLCHCARLLVSACRRLVIMLLAVLLASAAASAQSGGVPRENESLEGGHYTIAVHTSGIKDGVVEAIRWVGLAVSDYTGR